MHGQSTFGISDRSSPIWCPSDSAILGRKRTDQNPIADAPDDRQNVTIEFADVVSEARGAGRMTATRTIARPGDPDRLLSSSAALNPSSGRYRRMTPALEPVTRKLPTDVRTPEPVLERRRVRCLR